MLVKNQIQEIASRNLVGIGSNFTGKEQFGASPKEMSFIGGQNFKTEDQRSNSYTIRLSAVGSSVDKYIAIHKGAFASVGDIEVPAGITVNALIGDGPIISTTGEVVTCTGTPAKVKVLNAYLNNNPTRFTHLKMTVNNTTQLDNPLVIVKYTPFGTPTAQEFVPSMFKDMKQTDDKRVEISLNHLQFDDQTVVYLKLNAGATLTLVMFPGATNNAAVELDQEARKAYMAQGINREVNNSI